MFDFKELFFDFWRKKDEYKSNIINSLFFKLDTYLKKTIEDVVNNESGLETEGLVYRIVDSGASGTFVGKENHLAYLYNSVWRLLEPEEGIQFYDKSLPGFIYWNGTDWKGIASASCKPDHNTLPGYDEFEHIDWSEPGKIKIDYDRVERDRGLVAMDLPTGFANRIDSSLDWDDATRTLTITGRYDVFYQGLKESFNGETIQISDDEGVHFVVYINKVLTDILVTSHDIFDNILQNYALVSLIYWNTNDNLAIVVADERHGLVMGQEIHHYIHENIGTKYYDGFDISGYTLITDSDAGISFDLTDGEIYDEDLDFDIEDGTATNQYEQVLTGNAEIPVIYKDDVTGAWTQSVASSLPYLTAGAGNLAYNNDDGDGTWSQVEVANNKFVLYTLIVTNDWQYPIKMVQGSEEYLTANAANLGAREEIIAFDDLPSAELSFLYRFVMKTSSSLGGTKNARIEELYDLRGMNGVNYKLLLQNAIQIT